MCPTEETSYDDETYAPDTEVDLDKVPVRDGYTFTGWYADEELTQKIEEVTMDSDKTVYAGWEKDDPGTPPGDEDEEYTSHYVSNGGTSYDDETYAPDTEVDLDKVPERDDYTFTGWYADEELTQKIEEVTMDSDKTVYAGWEKDDPGTPPGDEDEEYTLHYVSNGGTSDDDETYAPDTEVDLDKVPERDGYTFTGWYADEELTQKIEEVTMDSDKTVYAGWEKDDPGTPPGDEDEEYTLHYVSNGGTSYDDETYAPDTEVDLDKVPVRDGYTFTGWYADEELTQKIEEVTMDSDKTVYAGWEKDEPGTGPGDEDEEYTLHYVSNGGTSYDDETYAPNTEVDLDKVPVRDGYTFTGWYADPELTDKITEVVMDSDKVVYAGWEKDDPGTSPGDEEEKYTLHYVSNGGTSYGDETYAPDTEVDLDKEPVRDGYTFTGWYSDPELTQKIEEVTMDSDKVVYAGWEKDDPGSENPGIKPSDPDDNPGTKPSDPDDDPDTIPSNPGNNPGTDPGKPDNDPGTVPADPDEEHKLHYESNGGTEYPDETYEPDTEVDLDKEPVRDGYTFTGWYADPELTQKITELIMDGDKTVYAGWKKNEPAAESDPGEPDDQGIPQTGDPANAAPWVVMNIASLTGLIVAVRRKMHYRAHHPKK